MCTSQHMTELLRSNDHIHLWSQMDRKKAKGKICCPWLNTIFPDSLFASAAESTAPQKNTVCSLNWKRDKRQCITKKWQDNIVLSSLAAHKKQHDKRSQIHEQMNVIGLNKYDGSFKVPDLPNCSKVLIWCSGNISSFKHSCAA